MVGIRAVYVQSTYSHHARVHTVPTLHLACPRSGRVPSDIRDFRFLTLTVVQRSVAPCSDQPQPTLHPSFGRAQPRPSTARANSHVSRWAAQSRDITSRTSFLPNTRPWTPFARRRPNTNVSGEFCMIEQETGERRESFRPLELSIYSPDGQLSPLPDFDVDWIFKPVELQYPAQAIIQSRSNFIDSDLLSDFTVRRKPVGSNRGHYMTGNQNSTTSARKSCYTDTLSDVGQPVSTSTRPISLDGLTDSRNSTPLLSILPQAPSPARSHDSTEASHHLHRRPSPRRANHDVDCAIREPSTIVEERRASALRAGSTAASPEQVDQHHAPAIAPAMRVRARSETPNDIGSASSPPPPPPPPTKPLPAPPAPPAPRPSSLSPGPRGAAARPARSPRRARRLARPSAWLRRPSLAPCACGSAGPSLFHRRARSPLACRAAPHARPQPRRRRAPAGSASRSGPSAPRARPSASKPLLAARSRSRSGRGRPRGGSDASVATLPPAYQEVDPRLAAVGVGLAF